MTNLRLSEKGLKLIELYEVMAKNGLSRTDGTVDLNTYNKFQLRKFRQLLLPEFQSKNIKTVLDYGSGGSDWKKAGFDTESGKSAKNYCP